MFFFLSVIFQNGDEIHYLHHFWYSDWPDHKTPDNPRALINMAVTVEALRQGNTLPPPLVSSHSDLVKNGQVFSSSKNVVDTIN